MMKVTIGVPRPPSTRRPSSCHGGLATWCLAMIISSMMASDCSAFVGAYAFAPLLQGQSSAPLSRSSRILPSLLAAEASEQETQEEERQQEQEQEGEGDTPSKIDSIIRDLHESEFSFRIVVIGNGAILESTSTLGPHMAESTSPKTGERLVTLASDERSFEFHLKPDTIAKVVFAESKKPDSGKTLRIVRMLREDGGPICSLILADGTEEAVSWYKTMTIRYGYEVRSGE